MIQEELRNRTEQVVASISLNISNKIRDVTLYQGEDLVRKVAQFFKEHSLRDEAVPIVEKKLRAAARKADIDTLLVAVPVLLDDGRLRILAVFDKNNRSGNQGEASESDDDVLARVNVTRVVRKAFAQWNVSLDMEDYEAREAEFIGLIEDIVRDHIHRKMLLELPLDAPDGRKLLLQV